MIKKMNRKTSKQNIDKLITKIRKEIPDAIKDLRDNYGAQIIVVNTMLTLTDKERDVFDLRLEGFTYQEIAMLLNITVKSVDGTISRIKQKILNIK